MSAQVTQTVICNMALSHVRKTPISAVTEQSENARKCMLFYDIARRAALRSCDWNFASSKVKLAELGNVDRAIANPTVLADQDFYPGFSFLYAEPANAIRFRGVFNRHRMNEYDPYRGYSDERRRRSMAQHHDKFKLVRSPVTNIRAIACDLKHAYGEITMDITDESQFDDMFVESFGYELALRICMPLTASTEVFSVVKGERDEFVGEAKRKNGGEGTERLQSSSDYEDAREY